MGAIQSDKMTRALQLIIKGGKTAAEASRITGITKGAISQNAEYRAHIDSLIDKFKPGGEFNKGKKHAVKKVTRKKP